MAEPLTIPETVSTIVVDVGKTVSKVTGWTRDGRLVDRVVRTNAQVHVDGIRRLDADGIGAWLRDALSRFAGHPVERIVPVAHGAAFVSLGPDGMAFAPFDYEATPPAPVLADYRMQRDPFSVTGSPALPDGLNLGAQLHWAEHLHAAAMADAVLVPWAQYWAWFLSGVAVSEVSSLGCHSDLWNPRLATFSPLAQRRGWAARFAPLVSAGEVLGPIRTDLATATGLPPTAQVLAGLHDSNAALLAARGFAEVADHEATVLSTGTWFIAMRLAGTRLPLGSLSEARDTLVNVDVHGRAVPSARFMGGREIERMIEIDTRRVDIRPDQPRLIEAVPALLERGTMMLPTLAPGCGPFPGGQARWIDPPDRWAGTWYARRAAICLYAALVADASLDLIGSTGRLLIEGRFAKAEVFVRALAALRPETAVHVANAHNDVSFGALRLIDPRLAPIGELRRVEPLPGDIQAYKARWTARMALETA